MNCTNKTRMQLKQHRTAVAFWVAVVAWAVVTVMVGVRAW